MIVEPGTLGQAFKRRRHKLFLTQAELARRLGMTQSHIAAVERGDRQTRWSTVVEIARALELEAMLIPRERITAVNAVLHLGPEDEVPPLTGDRW
ncbi:MAG: helix-turn-helix domain-containing protein [Candidatus Eremiobacteraeota bacterium]|nr:helix-turn-helix domain-containing protein [Candidatus Eremiobacteraeota bacterium]